MMAEELELEAIQARLKAWFESKMPQASGLSLSPLRRPGSGRSNETFSSSSGGSKLGK